MSDSEKAKYYNKKADKYKQKYLALKRQVEKVRQNSGQSGGNPTSRPERAVNVKTLFSNDDNAFRISGSDETKFKRDGYASTYGELTAEGMKQMFEGIPTRGKKYCDLGSGSGATVLNAVANHGCDHGFGVELATDRHCIAERASRKLPPHLRPKVKFINSDMFAPSIKTNDRDLVFISSLCFDDNTLSKLQDKLERELKPGAHIFSSRPLFSRRLRLIREKPVKMTWSPNSTVYIYQTK